MMLVKFGLKNESGEYNLSNGTGLFFMFNSQWNLYRRDANGIRTVKHEIESVHLAQNLIYFLTGQELTIKN